MPAPSEQDFVIAAKLRSGKKLTSAEIARLQLPYDKQRPAEWSPCAALDVSDIVRWTEPTWTPGETASDAVVLGRRIVTAQVLGRDSDRVTLAFMSEEWENAAPSAPPLKPGEVLRRKLSQLTAGKYERLSR